MRAFILSTMAALLIAAAPAAAQSPKRVALVIGNNTYQSITPLHNPRLDAGRLAGILAAHGFDVASCDGQRPGCFDLTRASLLDALDTLERKAQGAELALVFYAGHGMQLRDAPSNVLAPVDLEFDCADMSMKRAVALEAVFKAVAGARERIVIIDACRNDPFQQCPRRGLAPVSFGTLTVPDAESFLLVSSTKPGQVALDGIEGEHSPFARALFEWLERSPHLHFHQLLQLHVAKAVIEATGRAGFTQVPETLTRGVAPDACLKGAGCSSDDRASALKAELERLRAERGRDQVAESFLALKEKGLGRQLSPEERRRELDELHRVVRELAAQADTRSEEALARMQVGDPEGAKKLYAEVLAAREQEAEALIARANALAAEKRREAAKAARSLAALDRLTNVAKAAELYKKAADLDPADAVTWLNYALATRDAGRLEEAKAGFEQAAEKARESKDAATWGRATMLLGEFARSQGSLGLASAERLYRTMLEMSEHAAKAQPSDAVWQRNLWGSHDGLGTVLLDQRNFAGALEHFKAAHTVAERLAKTDVTNTRWQNDLFISHSRIGYVQRAQENFVGALESYRAGLDVAERLVKTEPTDARWQQLLGVSHDWIGITLRAQGNLAEALKSFQISLAIAERVAKTDATNTIWQFNLLVAYHQVGAVLQAHGDLAGALASFKAKLAINEHLVRTAPTNVFWQQTLANTYSDIAGVLQAQGDRGGALASRRKALHAAEVATASGEEAETKSAGKPGATTAGALGTVAWHALFAREFKKAVAVSERAHALAPDLVWIDSNRAHALMFLRRTREARALYLMHKGKMERDKPWEQAIAGDFDALRKAGLAHPLMAQIERALGVAQNPAAKQGTGHRVGK